MVILDIGLSLLGFGIIFGVLLFICFPALVVVKAVKDDPHFFDFPELPDVDDMADEGWELAYSAGDHDYDMLAQVFYMESCSKYRVILCDTSYSGGVNFDEECESYEQAKEIADEWADTYLEDN
jgi:hypothetical protein